MKRYRLTIDEGRLHATINDKHYADSLFRLQRYNPQGIRTCGSKVNLFLQCLRRSIRRRLPQL